MHKAPLFEQDRTSEVIVDSASKRIPVLPGPESILRPEHEGKRECLLELSVAVYYDEWFSKMLGSLATIK